MTDTAMIVEVRVKKEHSKDIIYHQLPLRRYSFNPVCPICLRENHIDIDSISPFGISSEALDEGMHFKLHPAFKTCKHYLYHYSEPRLHPGDDYVWCRTVFADI